MATANAIFNNASQNANSYLWTFGDGASSTDKSPSHAYALPGVYIVRLTASGPGGSASVEKPVSVTFGSINTFLASDFLDQLADNLGNQLIAD